MGQAMSSNILGPEMCHLATAPCTTPVALEYNAKMLAIMDEAETYMRQTVVKFEEVDRLTTIKVAQIKNQLERARKLKKPIVPELEKALSELEDVQSQIWITCQMFKMMPTH